MIIAETVIVVSLLCTSPKRGPKNYFISAGAENGFQLASGPNMEEALTTELEDLYGVHSAVITNLGDSAFTVDVIINDLEFETYRGVARKESEWLTKFPESSFEFNVSPLSVASSTDAILHAA